MMAQTDTLNARWKARFFTIWTGQAFSLFGSQLVQFALVWWLTETTHSATILATATLVAVLPQVILGPISGPLIDRWNRKRVMMTADSLVALATLVLVMLCATRTIEIWHVYLVMFFRSAAGSFHFPSMQASTSLIVPENQLARVAGLNQMLQGLMSIVAPPAGALLIGVLPMHSVLLIDIVTALIAVLSLAVVHIPQPERAANASGQSGLATFWQDMRGGFTYILNWRGLTILIGIAMIFNLVIMPAISLVPLLVTNHFGGHEGELAALNSAMGIGMVIGSIALSIWGGFKRQIFTILMGALGMSACFIIVGLAPSSAFGLAVATFSLLGIMQPITNGPLFAILQSVVAPEMQGRVFTLLMSGTALMMPLGLAVTGPLADRIGILPMYIIAGVVCVVVTVAGLFSPAVLNLENHHQTVGIAPTAEATTGAD
ncbi:MAG TPA: MFS transporter [Phototrophicaceae bacterium]|nr:MFS transporter [Phototrophicaceae bacterium]